MLKTPEPQITNELKWLLIEKVLFRAEIKRQNYLKNGIFELHFRVFFSLYFLHNLRASEIPTADPNCWLTSPVLR